MTEILNEPHYDFAQFRDWCEMMCVPVGRVGFEFLLWLYSDANSAAHS